MPLQASKRKCVILFLFSISITFFAFINLTIDKNEYREEILISNFAAHWREESKKKFQNCFSFECDRRKECDDTIEILTPQYLKQLYRSGKKPCCTHMLFNILLDVHQVLSSFGIQYFITFGTLLGAVRDNKIIPWTQDVDISISVINMDKVIKNGDLINALYKKGYIFWEDDYLLYRLCILKHWRDFSLVPFYKVFEKGVEKELIDGHNFPYLDIYLYDAPVPIGTKQYWYLSTYSLDITENVTIYGIPFPAPKEYKKLLIGKYGDDYMIPKKS